MATLTLTIDDALLQQAREEDLRSNTLVNALVREFFSRYVEARGRRLEALARFEAVAATSHRRRAGPWSPDALHDNS